MDIPLGLEVVDIDVIAIRIPLKEHVHMSGIRFEYAENVLVRLTAPGGVTGWGECTSAEQMTGERPRQIAESIAAARHAIVPALPASLESVYGLFRALLRGSPAAESAVSIAVHDLIGRFLGVPLHEILSAEPARALLATVLLGNKSADDDLRAATEAVAGGVRSLKLKIGRRSGPSEAKLLVDIRQVVGEETVLGADANGGLDLESAMAICRLAGAARLDYLEEPLKRDSLADLALLRSSIDVPITIDESATSTSVILAHRSHGAADGAVLKLQKFGGIQQMCDVARASQNAGMSLAYTGKIAESSIASGALLHVATALGGSVWGVSLTNSYLERDIVLNPIMQFRGHYNVDTAPGLGVDVCESSVDSLRVDFAELS